MCGSSGLYVFISLFCCSYTHKHPTLSLFVFVVLPPPPTHFFLLLFCKHGERKYFLYKCIYIFSLRVQVKLSQTRNSFTEFLVKLDKPCAQDCPSEPSDVTSPVNHKLTYFAERTFKFELIPRYSVPLHALDISEL